MSVAIQLDLDSGVPVYAQIRSQIEAHVQAGNLSTGDRLPTVRDLAADLGIAPGTVMRAYRELEHRGTVATRRRTGTVITARSRPQPDDSLHLRAAAFAGEARAAGLNDTEILDLVRGTLLASDDGMSARPPCDPSSRAPGGKGAAGQHTD